MKKIRFLSGLIVLIVLLLAFSLVFADGITVTLNGKMIDFKDVKPQILQSRTMVPLRAIFEALGLEVGWDGATQTITSTTKDKVITLQVGNLTAQVNDTPVTLDMSAVIIGGRTMVPVRFIAESLGAAVGWEPKVRNVAIRYFAFEEERLKSEIGFFLEREKALLNELEAEKAKADALTVKYLQTISSLKIKYVDLNAKMTNLKAKYKPVDLSGDTYYGPVNSQGIMHGLGLYVYDNGDYFIGDILNGKYTGTGVYKWVDGDYYVGAFVNSNFHGYGLLNGNEAYYKFGLYVNDVAKGQFYYQDFTDDYVFAGFMQGSDFGNGRQIESSGAVHYNWMSTVSKKKVTYELYKDGEYLCYEQPDPTTGFGFTMESYFQDTHLLRYMNLDTEQTMGNGVSYIVGSDYVYYGEFFDRYYEMADSISYYNINGDFFDFQNKIDAIIAEVTTPQMTDLEKELALHDYLIKTSRYNPDEVTNNIYPAPQHMAYEIIFAGEGICEAYAEAMNILLNRVGIKSIILGGSVGDVGDQANWAGHAWNYVKVGNAYYHLDATWNDPTPDNPNTLVHEYFNVTDSFMARDHEWKESLDEIEAFKIANPLQ